MSPTPEQVSAARSVVENGMLKLTSNEVRALMAIDGFRRFDFDAESMSALAARVLLAELHRVTAWNTGLPPSAAKDGTSYIVAVRTKAETLVRVALFDEDGWWYEDGWWFDPEVGEVIGWKPLPTWEEPK